jgi:hypothetical protein
MPDLYNRRDVATKKLESAQVKLIKMAQQQRDNTREKITKLEKKGKPVPEDLRGPVNPDLLRPVGTPGTAERGDVAFPMDDATLSRADQLVPRGQRPMTRLKPSWAPFGLGFLGIGEKVDTIDWARKEIAECSEGLEKSREQLRQDVESPGTKEDNYPPLNSAFIHFNQQIAAHMAVQCLPHHQPYVSRRLPKGCHPLIQQVSHGRTIHRTIAGERGLAQLVPQRLRGERQEGRFHRHHRWAHHTLDLPWCVMRDKS